MSLHRRDFLRQSAGLGAALLGSQASGQVLAPPASNKRIAALVSCYYRYSHADNIVTRFFEGYSINGQSFPPPCRVASLYIDQIGENDLGRPLANRWGVPVYKSIAEALTLGGDRLAVDGVVIVVEQGDYPTNDRGQIMYPRRRFFEEVVKVFRDSKKVVPVFNDKHLAYNWKDAAWIYSQVKELGIPMMAGSSIPVTHRRPDLRPKIGTPWEEVLGLGYAHFEVYGFHTMEGMQVMAERRPGGETGVKAVQCLQGKALWDAAAAGRWDRRLLDAAAARVPTRRGQLETVDANALAYLVEYRDGLKGTAYVSAGHTGDFGFAGREKGSSEPLACWYDTPKPQRDHFSFLVGHAAKMMVTGKPTYPVERTLLTTGMLAAAMESKANGDRRIETPHLAVEYQPAVE
jgi:hypothetical protein